MHARGASGPLVVATDCSKKRVVSRQRVHHACNMNDVAFLNAHDYARIERAIVFIAEHFHAQPTLEQLAAQVALSPAHFNRLFRQWAGITPKQFVLRLTLDAAKWHLTQAHSVMRAALEAGLSGPGRLHDLFMTLEAMTPGEYKSGGAGLALHYGVAATPFGPAWLVWNERGLCQLQFLPQSSVMTERIVSAAAVGAIADAADEAVELRHSEAQLQQIWPNAQWHRDDVGAATCIQSLWLQPSTPLRLLVHGSNFQLQVWRALLQLQPQAFTDYGSLAAQLGRPQAARAIGNAVGANPLLCLIPCHHVLRANGGLGGYAGGVPRKQAILAWEYAQRASE